MQYPTNRYYKKTGKILFPVFLFLILVIHQISFGQRHEYGLGIGGFNYVGDINPRYNFKNYRPAATLFYRYNFINRYTAIKLGVTLGQISGNDKYSHNQASNLRGASFTSGIQEVSLMGEYNFINYRDKKQLLKFSPYMTAGVAIFASGPNLSSNSTNENIGSGGPNFAIPFGVGLKIILGKYLNLGTEFVARKTFTDYLDGISTAEIATKSTANPLDTDWYFYTGISLSYTIYGVNCPQEYKY
jgi:hypothetical protein